LLQANAGSRKQRDDAASRRDVARERVRAAEERLHAARQAVVRLRRWTRPQELEAARARVAMVDAQIASLLENKADAQVFAPADGVVVQRVIDPGEVAAALAPLLVTANLDRPWVNVYVEEPTTPRLRLKQPATIYTDAGGPGITGEVVYISPTAEFTPRNVQTAAERSRLVYRVKIAVSNRDGVLKSGMPVEAELPLQPVGSQASH